MGFYGSVAYMAEAGMTNAKKPLGQRGLANKWRLTCIWWRQLILYLSLGLGCMVVQVKLYGSMEAGSQFYLRE